MPSSDRGNLPVDPFSRVIARLLAGVLLGAGVLLIPAAHAQEQPGALAEAKQAYQFADYQRAVDLFSQVAQDREQTQSTRRKALRYLGRAYVAKDQAAKARETLRTLLETEPPQVKLDPNVEPPPLMDLYYRVRKKQAGSYKAQGPGQGPGVRTLAVMDFTNSSVDENARFAPLQQGLPSMMINHLNGTTDLKVIERERVQWLLDELKLQKQAEVVDQSTAVRTGKLLGAHAVVFGSYTVHEDRMWLSARVVKVETSEIMLAEQIFGQKDKFFELVKDLSAKVSQAMNAKVNPEQSSETPSLETQSLDAMMAYSDGLALLEEGDYQAAYKKFKEAQKHDPNYKRAEIKAQSLRPMLASAEDSSQQSRMNR